MTEKEQIKFYKRLTKQMVKESLNEVIDRKLDKVFKVGVININDFELDYLLPKIIASALLKEAAFQARPLGSEYKDLVEQLYNKM
jgi:hypothetical protein